MDQIGEVVEVQGKHALVRIQRASSCGERCAECSAHCTPTSSVVRAVNGLSAKTGDRVKLQMSTGPFLLLALIGYILPILITIAAYFLVLNLSGNDLAADIAAIAALLLTLAAFYVLDKVPKRSTRFSTRIIRIIR